MTEYGHKLIFFSVPTQSLPPFPNVELALRDLAGWFGGKSGSWGLAPLLAKLICEDECEVQG